MSAVEEMMPEFPENPGITHVLYHGYCFDGFTSAWIARNTGVLEENIYPMLYGGGVPDLPAGAKVLMVDFCLDREALIELHGVLWKSGGELVVIDHHKSAEAQLHGLDWAYFDMNESGASLAWKFFHPEDSAPKLVQYIREHDLWRFELQDSAEIRAYIRSFTMTYKNWDELNTTLRMDFAIAQQEGSAIKRSHEAAVSAMCENAVMLEIGGYTVPVVNATVYFSEVATRLLKLHPTAEFACYYMDRSDGWRQWGMRSRTEFDVSKVAKRYGGGGHAQAAGFQTKVPNILEGDKNE
jgi:oligoribonuclease NrnB/cAMP/cGMP phosphodiesterase (DHH superfamily)